MSIENRVQLYEDKIFLHEANRFRIKGDNEIELRKRLIELGYDSQAELLDKLKWLPRLKQPTYAEKSLNKGSCDFMGNKQPSKRPFHFLVLPCEPVDAVEWLDGLGALRLDNHFQCIWAACTVVIATDGWRLDNINRRGRRWTMRPPDLPRAAFLLHWRDHRDVFNDWKHHLDRLKSINISND